MKKIYFCLLLTACLSFQAYSQSQETSNESSASTSSGVFTNARAPYCNPCKKRHYGACTPPPTSTPVPFDGGLSVLLVAGAAYGVRRVRKNKNKASI